MATQSRLSYDVPVALPAGTVGQFGDKFRKAREKKELSLDDVSNVTKISARMLKAIEDEHFDQLPGGVFNKGFIRAYSKHLGLNDEEAITDYLACLRQAQIDAHEVWEPEQPRAPQSRRITPDRRRRADPDLPSVKPQSPVEIEELPHLQLPRADDVRPRRKELAQGSSFEIPWGILAVAAVILVLVTILWMRHSRNTNIAATGTTVQASTTEKTPPEKSVTGTTAPNTPPPLSAAPAAKSPSSPANSASLSSPPASASPQPPMSHSATAPPTTDPGDQGKNQGTSQGKSQGTNKDNAGGVSLPAAANANPKPPEKSAAALKLVIRATESSWISVSADGQTVTRETLIAPANTSVRGSSEIVVRVGNAAGVSFLWNGQEIPADGAEGEAKTFIFNSTGVHVSAPNPPAPQNP